MLSTMRSRAKSESGFTLIELLVVMIIISILMAVAVPTFLSQKQSALKTKATGNIDQVTKAIDSCATNNTDGSYQGCVDQATLLNYEKSFAGYTFPTTITPTSNDKTFQVVPILASGAAGPATGVGAMGYMVQTRVAEGNASIYFAEINRADGRKLKLCSYNAALTVASTTGAPNANSKICKTGGASAGTW